MAIVGACAAPASASAVELDCGATVTEDTTLTADVVCAEEETAPPAGGQGFALFIGADGVTLDLNGHKVGSRWSEGISIVGRSSVTVQNGSTPEIHLRGTTDSRIADVQAWWIYLIDSDRNRIAQSGGSFDLDVDSDRNVLERNTAGGEGGGISISGGSDYNQVRSNTICGGMYLALTIGDSNHNLVENNIVPACSGYSDTSMWISGTGNQLIGNTVIGEPGPFEPREPDVPQTPGDGIYVASATTYLAGNITSDNHGYGINAVEGVESGVNYANGNGNPAQCRNVICVSGSPPAPAGPPKMSGLPGPASSPGATASSTAADVTSPVASLAAKKTQKLGRAIRVAASATREDLWATARGRISIAGTGRTYRLTASRRSFVAQGKTRTLRLALPSAARTAARRALDRGKRVKALLRVRVTDSAGNGSVGGLTISVKR